MKNNTSLGFRGKSNATFHNFIKKTGWFLVYIISTKENKVTNDANCYKWSYVKLMENFAICEEKTGEVFLV